MQAGATLTLIGNRLLDALWPERKTLASLRSAWGSLGDKRAWLESDYFDLVRRRPDRVLVDDRTCLLAGGSRQIFAFEQHVGRLANPVTAQPRT